MYLAEKNSQLQTTYRADTNAVYKQEMVFDFNMLDHKHEIDTSLKEHQYLVLRTRTRVDEKGNLIEAYYSKIIGPWIFIPRQMTFSAAMNTDPNSTSLECGEVLGRRSKPDSKWRRR